METLGSFIQKERKKRRLSLREFADLCDLSHSYVDSLEKEKDARTGKPVSPTVETVKKLAKGLQLPIQDLIEIALAEEPSNQPPPLTQPEPPQQKDDDDIFMSSLAANMESEYGKKPSPEFLTFAKNLRKNILEEVEKRKGK